MSDAPAGLWPLYSVELVCASAFAVGVLCGVLLAALVVGRAIAGAAHSRKLVQTVREDLYQDEPQ